MDPGLRRGDTMGGEVWSKGRALSSVKRPRVKPEGDGRGTGGGWEGIGVLARFAHQNSVSSRA